MARLWAPIASTIASSWNEHRGLRAAAGRVISRTLVIVLALAAAAYRASQAAWVETVGLACLGAGLICLAGARRRPALKPLAWLAFLGTAISMTLVLLRGRML